MKTIWFKPEEKLPQIPEGCKTIKIVVFRKGTPRDYADKVLFADFVGTGKFYKDAPAYMLKTEDVKYWRYESAI